MFRDRFALSDARGAERFRRAHGPDTLRDTLTRRPLGIMRCCRVSLYPVRAPILPSGRDKLRRDETARHGMESRLGHS